MKNFSKFFSFSFFVFLLVFGSVNAQTSCGHFPCAPCTIEGNVVTNSTDCGLTNSISVTLTTGVPPFAFVIKKSGQEALPPVVQDSPVYNWENLSPGHYYVWALDSNFCIWTGECKNLGPVQLNIYSANLCGADNYICTYVEGGTPPYTYLWSNDSSYDCLNNVPTGTYTVTVTDANGCTETASSEVQTSTDVVLSINVIQPTCEKLGEANLKALGGIPPYYFVVRKNGNTGNVIAIGSDSLLNVKNLTTGTYSVIVTDNAGCNQKGAFVINPQPLKKETQVFLSGCGSVTLPWGEVVFNSGVFVKKYAMTNGCDSTVTVVVTSTASQDSLLSVEEHCGPWTAPSGQVFTESGYYLDSILDNDGCQKRLVTGVFIKKPAIRIFMDSYCYGTTPSIIVDGTEYNADTVLVSDCNTTFIHFTELAQPEKVKLPDTIFCLSPFSDPVNKEQIMEVVKNTSGCDSIIYYRNLIGSPVVMITDTVTICSGDEFTWDKNNQTYKDQGLYMHIDSSTVCKKYYQLALFQTQPGIVFKQIPTCDSLSWFTFVEAKDNCDSDTIYFSKLVLNEKLIQANVCKGSKFLFEGIEYDPGTYILKIPGLECDTLVTLIVYELSLNEKIIQASVCDGSKFIFQDLEYGLGTYVIRIPGLECDTLVTLVISQSPSIFFSSDVQNISCFGFDDGEISVEIFSDNPEMTIEWSNGVMEERTINLSSGIYSVTITNSYGCSAGESFMILEPQKLVLSLDTTNVTCKGNDGEIMLDVSGGTLPYHFLWNNIYESQNLEDLSFGTYSVVVTDDNGCSESVSTVLLEPECAPPMSDCEIVVATRFNLNGPRVEINNDRLTGLLFYYVFDMKGSHVYQGNLGNISPGFHYNEILELPLENGEYFILFTVGNWYSPCFRFFIQK